MRGCLLQVARTDDGYLVRIEGQGTLQSSPALAAFVNQSFAAAFERTITLDLNACQYLDSTFLGCLLTLHQRSLATRAGKLRVLADEAARKRLLACSRLDRLLPLADTRPAPLSDFVPLGPVMLNTVEFGRHIIETHAALAEVPSDHSQLYRDIAERLARELQSRPSCT